MIETEPSALGIAARLDVERRAGRVRGPLHGIPVLVKDNIATADHTDTTVGSLALAGSRVPSDAPIVARLRDAGAVVFGKANLSEWANFRGFARFNGRSVRGGFTRDPYLLDLDPCGSSSGSAVAPAAGLCAAAVGTETDASIVCPAGQNLVVGLKPTLGLLAEEGIIPIAHSQDTAGPMARTVTDVAIVLGAMQSPFGPVAGRPVPTDYTQFLRRNTLRGARIGVDRRHFRFDFGSRALAEAALDAMRDLGATLVDTDTGAPIEYFAAEQTVLRTEFKVDIAAYLATLRRTRMRSLADLIAFNQVHCEREMKYFGQELFEMAEETNGLDDPAYVAARELCIRLARTEGIDAALQRDDLAAIVAPSDTFASTPPAVAGYPNISIPTGISSEGRPGGLLMYGGFLAEPALLGFAYDLEQEMQARQSPAFAGQVPPEPPDAGICDASPSTSQLRSTAASSVNERALRQL